MFASPSDPIKFLPEVLEYPKITHKKNGNNIVLIPQPSDDPQDPLVSGSELLCR